MKRLFTLLLHQPLSIIKIILWNIRILYCKVRGMKTIVYNFHYDYFICQFSSFVEKLQKQNVKIFYAVDKNIYTLVSNITESKGIVLIDCKVSPFVWFDLFICPEVTGPDFPLKFFPTKKLQIYHGTGVYNLYQKKALLTEFDYHFSVGPQFDRFFNDSNITNYRSVGYPKTDRLINYRSKNVSKRKIVLYAPHWTEFSSIHTLGKEIIECCLELEYSLILKPHNFIYTEFPYRNWKEELKSNSPFVEFATSFDTQEYYSKCDLLISDVGTTVPVEFSLVKKPIILFDRFDWFKVNGENRQPERDIYDASFKFTSLKELYVLLEQMKLSNDTIRNAIEEQIELLHTLNEKYLYNIGSATEHGLSYIEEILGLPHVVEERINS